MDEGPTSSLIRVFALKIIDMTNTMKKNDPIQSIRDHDSESQPNAESIIDEMFMVGSFHRLNYFYEHVFDAPDISWNLPPADYWRALFWTWQSSDNGYKMRDQVRAMFWGHPNGEDGHDGVEQVMTPEERDVLNGLPDMVTVYRGMTVAEAESKNYGVSWTLSRERAEFFAYEYIRNVDTKDMKKTVVELTVPKLDIIAYLNGRTEQEVIVLFGLSKFQ